MNQPCFAKSSPIKIKSWIVVAMLVLFPLINPVHSSELSKVKNWLYLIDVNLDETTVSQITQSTHDLVVIDYIPSEAENSDYPIGDVVEEWHEAQHSKQILAYIDVGQAESYRSYWREDWKVGDPYWITGEDPDGWVENYPVAYWHAEWRAIWLGDGGIIEQIAEAGFDGVYLDWIEAYSDIAVAKAASRDGIDAEAAMIEFIADIATLGRNLKPGFLIIGQNALELVEHVNYRNIVDGVAQEQAWFDGGADNMPPGDCPLPKKIRDVETKRYLDQLSPVCRLQHNNFPDSTLHMSSEEYLEYMKAAQSFGLVVLTVDYALDPANINWVRKESRRHGFIPFVGARSLDSFVSVK
jgi:cysteinyl-tRNA synthetase